MPRRAYFSAAKERNKHQPANGSPKSPEAPPSMEKEMSEQPEVPELPKVEVSAAKSYSIDESDLLTEQAEDIPPGVAAVDAGQAPAPSLEAYAAAMLRIAESMEKINARAESVRQIPFNEVIPDTPWNPKGKRDRVSFTRPTFLHGIALNPLMHTEEEIQLFNKLKPGRYLDRKVEVQRGNDGSMNLKWEGKKIDQRIMFYSEYPTISLLLSAIIKDREVKEEKRRKGLTYEEDVFS